MKKSTWIIIFLVLIVLLVLSFLTWKSISGNITQESEKVDLVCNFLDTPLGSCVADAENSTQVYTSLAGKKIRVV